ncbi:MAG: hypothetical protein PHI98_04210 [Eubacteriales bacterium]|nr:hypothetical protein [Eubacteriales bacterium]
MAQYTIEDIEILRKKSGVTYEEAVNLLEYHNGSLARSLVDLEKNGRLKSDKGGTAKTGGFRGLIDYLFRLRVKAHKKDVTILNLSSLFMLAVLLLAPHIVIIGLILAVVLGYRISFERNSTDFSVHNIDEMLKTAKNSVQSTVSSISKQFGEAEKAGKADAAKPEKPRSEAAPSGTTPVNVQFPGGGSVDVREDEDGYHEADIQ